MRIVYLMALVLIVSITSFSNVTYGAPKSKSLILTTTDIRESYEVIDIVTYRVSSTSMDDLIKGIRKEAMKLGADAVVGLSCFSYADYLYAYGTAVSFKK